MKQEVNAITGFTFGHGDKPVDITANDAPIIKAIILPLEKKACFRQVC